MNVYRSSAVSHRPSAHRTEILAAVCDCTSNFSHSVGQTCVVTSRGLITVLTFDTTLWNNSQMHQSQRRPKKTQEQTRDVHQPTRFSSANEPAPDSSPWKMASRQNDDMQRFCLTVMQTPSDDTRKKNPRCVTASNDDASAFSKLYFLLIGKWCLMYPSVQKYRILVSFLRATRAKINPASIGCDQCGAMSSSS